MSIVLFSGGCDSTLTLYESAVAAFKCNERVTALSINHTLVPAQDEQKLARAKIRAEFKARHLPIDYVEISHIAPDGVVIEEGLAQPVIWLSQAALYVMNNDSIIVGYHSGDDYWHYKTLAETALKSLCLIIGKTVDIKYPLEYLKKKEIITRLMERNLYDLCWYCEAPNLSHAACGFCAPCQTHLDALLSLASSNKHIEIDLDALKKSIVMPIELNSEELSNDVTPAQPKSMPSNYAVKLNVPNITPVTVSSNLTPATVSCGGVKYKPAVTPTDQPVGQGRHCER